MANTVPDRGSRATQALQQRELRHAGNWERRSHRRPMDSYHPDSDWRTLVGDLERDVCGAGLTIVSILIKNFILSILSLPPYPSICPDVIPIVYLESAQK